MYRLINYAFGFILIYLFILEGNMADHTRIVTGLGLSFFVASISFIANWITLNATKSVIILGTIVFGFAGWGLALAVLFFFLSSSILTALHSELATKKNTEQKEVRTGFRRTGYQVWANGFWIAFFCTLWFATGIQPFLIASFASVAVAIADTWATEIGTQTAGKTVHILSWKPVEPGTDGGISVKGSLASLAGAVFLGFFVIMTPVFMPFVMWGVILFAGIAGSVTDSLAGAYLSKQKRTFTMPADYSGNKKMFLNDIVNWLSTGIGGLLALLLTQIFTG